MYVHVRTNKRDHQSRDDKSREHVNKSLKENRTLFNNQQCMAKHSVTIKGTLVLSYKIKTPLMNLRSIWVMVHLSKQ